MKGIFQANIGKDVLNGKHNIYKGSESCNLKEIASGICLQNKEKFNVQGHGR